MLHHRLVLPLLLAAARVAIGSADPVSRHRSLQQQINGTNVADDDSCSESPFIWLIRKQGGSNGATPLGFAVGILENLPEEQLVSDGAWQSIKDVADDSCAVYGESIFTAGCLFGSSNDIYENSATVNDIPDPDLRERYVQRLRQIAVDHIGDDVTGWVERLSSRPLWGVFEILALDNTPEVRESSLPPLFTLTSEDDVPQWATAVLDLGTLKGQLETREESCDWWNEEYVLLREVLLQDYDAEWADRLERALTAGYSSLAQQYRCGDLEGIEDTFANNHNTVPAHILDQTYNFRNLRMADRLVRVLEQSRTPSVFALGLEHWIHGDSNLIGLLQDQGYTFTKVEGQYDASEYPSISEGVCRGWNDVVEEYDWEEYDRSSSANGGRATLLCTSLAILVMTFSLIQGVSC